MSMMDALRLLIANGRTVGLATKATRLCELGLISLADRDTVVSEIENRAAEQ